MCTHWVTRCGVFVFSFTINIRETIIIIYVSDNNKYFTVFFKCIVIIIPTSEYFSLHHPENFALISIL